MMFYAGEKLEKEFESPLDTLPDDQKKIMKELQEKVEKMEEFKSEAIQKYLTPTTYYRYIYGWKFDLTKAWIALEKTVKWRHSYKPEDITIEEINEIAGDVKEPIGYTYGYDKTGHPVLYLHLANTDLIKDDDDGEKKFKLVVFAMESAFNNMMPKGRHNLTLVVDASKIGLLWVGVVKRFGKVFQKLGDYYCEMLNKACCVNCGFVIRSVWTIAQAFMEKSTVAKFMIEKKPEKLLDIIDADQLPEEFGGKAKFKYNIKDELEFGKKKMEE